MSAHMYREYVFLDANEDGVEDVVFDNRQDAIDYARKMFFQLVEVEYVVEKSFENCRRIIPLD